MAKRSIVPWYAPPRKRSRRTKMPKLVIPKSLMPETKFTDRTSTVASSFFNAFTVLPLQGDDGDDFIGSKINLRSLDVTSFVSTPTNVRVSVLIPKDPSVAPTSIGPNLKYSQHDFHILYDEFFTAPDKSGTRFKISLNGKTAEWNTLGSTVLKNNIYVVTNSSVSNTIISSSRLYYNDP